MKTLSPEEQKQLDAHLQAISDILFHHSDGENIQTLEQLELTVREHMTDTLGPAILKIFLPNSAPTPPVVPEQ